MKLLLTEGLLAHDEAADNRFVSASESEAVSSENDVKGLCKEKGRLDRVELIGFSRQASTHRSRRRWRAPRSGSPCTIALISVE